MTHEGDYTDAGMGELRIQDAGRLPDRLQCATSYRDMRVLQACTTRGLRLWYASWACHLFNARYRQGSVPRKRANNATVIQAIHKSSTKPGAIHGWPSSIRARVWVAGTDGDGATTCQLWLLDTRQRLRVLQMPAECMGRDEYLDWATGAFERDAGDAGTVALPTGRAEILPGAPAMPALDSSLPLQQQLKVARFWSELDGDVLQTLHDLERPGLTLCSASNYSALAALPDPIRQRRLQALTVFPPLLIPVLLDRQLQPRGADGHVHILRRWEDCGRTEAVLMAIDEGHELLDLLARTYGVGRSLLRAAICRTPNRRGGLSHRLLALMDALPNNQRAVLVGDINTQAQWLDALPVGVLDEVTLPHLAKAFSKGWDTTWHTIMQTTGNPAGDENADFALYLDLRNTRRFLRAILDDKAWVGEARGCDVERLGVAWLARHGLASLLEASRRWHQSDPKLEVDEDAELTQTVPMLFGTYQCDEGTAHEIQIHADLQEEGENMGNCVAAYWSDCVLEFTRIVHLRASTGEEGTAEFQVDANGKACVRLGQLEGPENQSPSSSLQRLAKALEAWLNRSEISATNAIRKVQQACNEERLRMIALSGCKGQRTITAADWRAACSVQTYFDHNPDLKPVSGHAERVSLRLDDQASTDWVKQMRPGDPLELVRPRRAWNAPVCIAIHWQKTFIGTLPIRLSSRITQAMRNRLPLQVHLVDLEDSDHEGQVIVEILGLPASQYDA